ncbi:MAG: ribose-5-phosphate isomerase RpiA [Gemmatimonadetes bacterium]|nr:ribose-5-phosphate isomerase RpiA [Gemmatimonadota bacterium]
MARHTVDELKSMAGRDAARTVGSGMRLGLGTGSTVAHFLESLGARIARGDVTDVAGVPTSIRTGDACRRLGIPLGTLEELAPLDLTVDGADEVAPGLDLIKGLGGALLREKMVAQASRRMIVIVDDTKIVDRLGQTAPVPVEVVPFEFASHLVWFTRLGADPVIRRDGEGVMYRTDNANLIVDCRFPGGIDDPAELEGRLARRAGVVESGLFLGLADEAIVAGDGGVRRIGGEGVS